MLRKYRGRVWVDYASDLVADTDWCPDLSDAARRSRADGMAAKTFANSYTLLCRLAGIEPGDTTERLTSHGPRRGLASALAEAGASEEDIARALRHRSPTSQQSYISEAIAPPRDLPSLVPDHLGPRPEPPPPSPALAPGARHTCGVEVRSPHGDHEPCGRTVAGRRADTPLCKRHLRCFDEHGGFTDRMSDPVDIKKNGWTCECDIVDNNGQQVGKCARPAVGCHDGLVLCTGHYARASKGWTGNRLRAPLGPNRGGGRPRKQ